jgi:hypothetical protein
MNSGVFMDPGYDWIYRCASVLLCFLKNFGGGFKEKVARLPLVTAGALGHENCDHAGRRIDRQISAIRAVVAEQAIAQMITQTVVDARQAA